MSDNLTRIGPVAADLGDPEFSWRSISDGFTDVRMSGVVPWATGQQLRELIDNRDRRVTVRDAVGVLEYVQTDHDLWRPFSGWYLLDSCELAATYESELGLLVGIEVTGVLLGDQRQVVVARSARARANDFGLDGQALVVNPFWGEDPDGEPFVVDPGGTFVTREYDPTSPHATDREAAANGERRLGMHIGTADELDTVVLPDLQAANDYDGQTVPRWITDRGGDCRAYDRREEREVYGPSHPLVAPTDLLVTNGLIRYWVGNPGLPPFLNVDAYAVSSWAPVGYLGLADPEGDVVLRSARLSRVTPEVVSVALAVQDQGEVVVTLRRGERMLRIQHGSSRNTVETLRSVRWMGLPPWSRLVSATQGTGKFGNGVTGSSPDFRLRLPAAL